ncbi:MAG: GNAT family N-acetyltransferase [Bacteroidales bacterium]|nr:GNAT family N-acetyltransferase [Bacteroidales bacterium]
MKFISEETISLRAAEPEDAPLIYDWENDRSLWRVSETSNPISLFQVEQFLLGNTDLTTNRQLRLMIDLKGADQPIGCIDLFDYDPTNSRIGIGILIAKKYRGKGYASKALSLCLEYLSHDVMVHQAHCLIDVLNEESRHLFMSLGFTECGRRKDWIKTPEGYLDVVFYQKIILP